MLKKTLIATLLVGSAFGVAAKGLLPIPNGPFGALVDVNPYGATPQTAVIKTNGHVIKDVSIVVHKKDKNGIDIKYPVADNSMLTHGGVPVFGLYPGMMNKVTLSWTEDGKRNSFDYKIFAEGLPFESQGSLQFAPAPMTKVVKKAMKGFENRLYLVEQNAAIPGSSPHKRNQKGPGAYDWDASPQIFIIDTAGDIRWTLDPKAVHDSDNPKKAGFLMDVNQLADGSLIYGQGQGYHKMDLIGRDIYHREIPKGYVDFSHEIEELDNGHVLMRVGKKDYKNDIGDVVDTVRDTVIEVDQNGSVVEEWMLAEILDPYRDITILALDQSAVCLNVDLTKQGHTVSKEDLAHMPYGDISGVNAGRNWAHMNSVGYSPEDDSIILSLRHQSATVKIGRDKKVKWILGDPRGWNKELAAKVLQPVDSKGRDIKCENGVCEGDFDWTWTQHTSWLSARGTLTVFDNGDARGNTQPALPSMKYSRAVEYKVNEKDMTVEQVWEFGKERGYEWYAPITSEVEYQADKKTMFIFNGSRGMFQGKLNSGIIEIDPSNDEVKVEIDIKGNKAGAVGYRAEIIKPMF
ncbi:aryl-sulfate sulfotransferase [Shewanella youngdeokensis]|uniref:Aryl-sulfate sulfotransferase n=1 Tax=Shewanella youngdeokensis TaxID=2999068 RepID=A0ABZ0K052_9GAMM|nr:aryl-sulfate sulfotransferase [Shewanella sp. DAU334]